MERRTLGRTGLDVPVVGMGTWRTFDVTGPEEHERRDVTDAALASGANLFDTSPMYGEAERVLADTVRDRRDQVIIADKVWTSSPREGRQQIERALAWYGGRIDIYQIHNLVAAKTHLPVLDRLRDEGKVRVVGATHYQHSAFGDLLALMRSGRIEQIQIPYNAADRTVEREILPAAADLGLGVLVMRPLGEGSLVQRSPPSSALERLKPFGVRTWAQALLKWILSDPRVHAVIPATASAVHIRENAESGNPPWFDEETRRYVGGLV
ncbi:MAG TPA: aldo/keto reductase [Gemmatimonadaceae bacterium]|nr:aldo/keto reductase [Gemmatimonadaceae bacterium]